MEEGFTRAKAGGGHKVTLTVFPHNHADRVQYSKFGSHHGGDIAPSLPGSNGELWDGAIRASSWTPHLLAAARGPRKWPGRPSH